MPDSDLVFESGIPVFEGFHGANDLLYSSGEAVFDSGDSQLVFERGTGLGGGLQTREIHLGSGATFEEGDGTPFHHTYDIATDTWTRLADMPEPRDNSAGAVVNGMFVVAGGETPSPEEPVSSVHRYDIASGVWEAGQDMPEAIRPPTSIAYNGELWTFGGQTDAGSFGGSGVVNRTYRYDALDDSWTQGPDYPVRQAEAAVERHLDNAYIFGGVDENGDLVPNCYRFDGSSFTRVADMPAPRQRARAATVEDRIHVVGGITGDGSGGTFTHQVYLPDSGTWDTSVADIPDDREQGAMINAEGIPVYVAGRNDAELHGYYIDDDEWRADDFTEAPHEWDSFAWGERF